jgi:hypothetical protein
MVMDGKVLSDIIERGSSAFASVTGGGGGRGGGGREEEEGEEENHHLPAGTIKT